MNPQKKKTFTLLEVLISIILLSLVLMALYRSADILRASNKNLFHYLERSSNIIKGANTLYLDILQSNGRLTITHLKKYHRIEIENSRHSLHGLYKCKVIWLVYKENNTLLRLEGNKYNLPLKEDDNIAIDKITENMEIFNIYKNKKKK
jgi:type II secretory pathway component PulJ